MQNHTNNYRTFSFQILQPSLITKNWKFLAINIYNIQYVHNYIHVETNDEYMRSENKSNELNKFCSEKQLTFRYIFHIPAPTCIFFLQAHFFEEL